MYPPTLGDHLYRLGDVEAHVGRLPLDRLKQLREYRDVPGKQLRLALRKTEVQGA
jgi:hypothetical protein